MYFFYTEPLGTCEARRVAENEPGPNLSFTRNPCCLQAAARRLRLDISPPSDHPSYHLQSYLLKIMQFQAFRLIIYRVYAPMY